MGVSLIGVYGIGILFWGSIVLRVFLGALKFEDKNLSQYKQQMRYRQTIKTEQRYK